MDTVYVVKSSPVNDVYETIERIFSNLSDADAYIAYLKRTDDSSGQYEYYVDEYKIFDHFNEMEER